jgi:hypothetical protein
MIVVDGGIIVLTRRSSDFRHEVIRDGRLSMNKGKRNALLATGLYLAVLALAWAWFHPYFVSARVRERVAIGATTADVESVFHARAYDFPRAAYCGKDGPPGVSRIAIDEAIRVPLLPLPMEMVTTTIFCFDGNDKLVGMKTERWVDEL